MDLTPKEIVDRLNQYVVGQDEAKKAVAIALRNRWRRMHAPKEMQKDITPNNILMIGPTGVGKTEIARRLADLVGAPFVKVEASKFTEVGYVGKDVESIIRDLAEAAFSLVRQGVATQKSSEISKRVKEELLDSILPHKVANLGEAEAYRKLEKLRKEIQKKLDNGDFDQYEIYQLERPEPVGGFFKVSEIADGTVNLEKILRDALTPPKTVSIPIKTVKEKLHKEYFEALSNPEYLRRETIRLVEESGIVFIDEVDKIASSANSIGPDVSREGVQRDLLPIVEGTTVKTKFGMIKTDYILFIAAGAFHVSKPSDLIPEFQGRFPIRVELDALSQDDFIEILTKPKAALTKQYQALVEAENSKLEFTPEAIAEIARLAYEANERMENIGARRLQTIMSKLLEDIMFELPDSSKTVIKITKPMVQKKFKDYVGDQHFDRYIL